MPRDFVARGERLDHVRKQQLSRLLDDFGDVKVSQWLGVNRNTLWRAAAGGSLQPKISHKIARELEKLAQTSKRRAM